jgi:cell division protein FtsN
VLGIVLLLGAGALVTWYFRSGLAPGTKPAAATSAPGAKPAGKAPKPLAEKPPAEAADRFEFYDVLPDAQVNVTEQSKAPRPPVPPQVTVPGTYVIQAGAFPNFAEADKVKARLALLGIVSEIQTADANGTRFHRVRIGPIDNLAELNRLRGRLRQSGIENLVIPVGE